jgi:hypothetical protein
MSKAKKIDWKKYWPYLAAGFGVVVLVLAATKGKAKGNGAALPPESGDPSPVLEKGLTDRRGQSNLPRGLRNNNPGNIVMAANDWKGKVPTSQNTDGKFEQFIAYEYGIRAMIVLLTNYINRYGLKTIPTIVERWCSGGCDINAYRNSMAQSTGLSLNQPLIADRDTVKRLIRGIVQVEQGVLGDIWINDADFNKAWELL